MLNTFTIAHMHYSIYSQCPRHPLEHWSLIPAKLQKQNKTGRVTVSLARVTWQWYDNF